MEVHHTPAQGQAEEGGRASDTTKSQPVYRRGPSRGCGIIGLGDSPPPRRYERGMNSPSASSPSPQSDPITVRTVEQAADVKTLVNIAWAMNKGDTWWVPPLKTEVHGLLDPRTNPWFEHGEARLFLAERRGRPVGRISAQVDRLVLEAPHEQGGGPGTGHWGMFEAADAEVAEALRSEERRGGNECVSTCRSRWSQ